MGLDTNLKDNKQIKSIKYKTILTFSIFSIFLIAFMWLFQAIYFTVIFEGVKSSELEYISTTISTIYKSSPNYHDKLIDLSIQNGVDIIIFNNDGEKNNLVFNSSREYDQRIITDKLDLLHSKFSEGPVISFTSTNSNKIKILNFGRMEVVDGQNYYFYTSAPIEPVKTTMLNFRYLLLFISIGVFSAVLIGSYTLSSQLSMPIVRMANKAKQLTKTNIDVQFNSNEYKEVQQLSDTLNYAIGELKKTDNLRKDMFANVSHELKTPLTMIKSYTELIRDISGDDKEKRTAHLEVVLSEAERLEFLINDMMDYSKLESGLMTYDKSEFNLSETLFRLKNYYSEKYKDFKFTLSMPKNVYIFADPKRIEQVLINLLNNAINYSSHKKIVNIRLKQINNTYKLEIVDHGIGISKDSIGHIFERHFRSTVAKRTTVGSGIGLSIVKSILDAHKFKIDVISTEGKGSNFFITIPSSTGDKS